MASVSVWVSPRTLPAKMIVAPNSPTPRAKASTQPASRPPAASGSTMRQNVRAGTAPSVRAASVSVGSTRSNAADRLAQVERRGHERDRQHDRPLVNGSTTPTRASASPNSPPAPKAASSAMPATAGGSTSGSSQSVTTQRAPGKRRVREHPGRRRPKPKINALAARSSRRRPRSRRAPRGGEQRAGRSVAPGRTGRPSAPPGTSGRRPGSSAAAVPGPPDHALGGSPNPKRLSRPRPREGTLAHERLGARRVGAFADDGAALVAHRRLRPLRQSGSMLIGLRARVGHVDEAGVGAPERHLRVTCADVGLLGDLVGGQDRRSCAAAAAVGACSRRSARPHCRPRGSAALAQPVDRADLLRVALAHDQHELVGGERHRPRAAACTVQRLGLSGLGRQEQIGGRATLDLQLQRVGTAEGVGDVAPISGITLVSDVAAYTVRLRGAGRGEATPAKTGRRSVPPPLLSSCVLLSRRLDARDGVGTGRASGRPPRGSGARRIPFGLPLRAAQLAHPPPAAGRRTPERLRRARAASAGSIVSPAPRSDTHRPRAPRALRRPCRCSGATFRTCPARRTLPKSLRRDGILPQDQVERVGLPGASPRASPPNCRRRSGPIPRAPPARAAVEVGVPDSSAVARSARSPGRRPAGARRQRGRRDGQRRGTEHATGARCATPRRAEQQETLRD